MKNMISVRLSRLTPNLIGIPPSVAQSTGALRAAARPAASRPCHCIRATAASTQLAAIASTATQPDAGLPSLLPTKASSTKLASGSRTPVTNSNSIVDIRPFSSVRLRRTVRLGYPRSSSPLSASMVASMR